MSNMTSNIDIYRIFREVPNISDNEAKQVADSVARVDQVATKADLIELEGRLDAKMLKLETKMLKLAIWAVAFNVTLTVSLVKLL